MAGLRRRLVAAYGAGAFGALLGFGVVPLLFLYFLTEVNGLPPAWAGVLLAVPKIADMLLDPWVGRQTDAFAARRGRRGSLLAVSLATLPVLLVLIFVPMTALPLPLRMTLLGLLLVAQSLLTTVFAVAHTALAGDLADTLEARGTLMASRAFGSSAAGLVVSALAPPLVAAFGQGRPGYLGMSLVLAALSAALLTIAWLACRRVPMRTGLPDETPGATVSLLRSLRLSLRNRAFYSVALMLVMLGTGSGALIALMPYVNQFVLGGSPEQLPRLLMPVFVALLCGVLAAPLLLRRLGPGRALLTGVVLATAGTQLLTGGSRSFSWMACGGALFGFGAGLLNVFITTLATHSASVDGDAAGRGRGLGLYLGVLFSAEKLGASAGGVLAGLALDWASLPSASGHAYAADRLASAWYALPTATLLLSLALLALGAKAIGRLGKATAENPP
jgi:Na+/melibiose symporter-like transporter